MLSLSTEVIGEGAARLKIVGEATVEHAAELRLALLEGLQEHEQLLVDCEQTTAIDFFAVQLLCSAHRSSVRWEKHLSFSGTPSAQVAEGIRRAGFARHRGCSLCPSHLRCLWL